MSQLTFIVKISTTTDQGRQEVGELLGTAAKAIIGKPREAHTYYFYRPNDDSKDKSIYGLEIYDSEKDLNEVHLKGDAFLALGKRAEELKAGFDLDYFNVRGGFLSKPGDKPTGLVVVAEIETVEGKRDELLALTKDLIDHVEKNEHDTLTYLWLESTKDANRIVVFERYTTKEAFEKHTKEGPSQAFAKASQSLVKSLSQQFHSEVVGYISDKQ